MRKCLHILLGCLLLGLPACEIPFSLDQDGEARIYLQCIGNDEGIRLMPQYAVPVSSASGTVKDWQVEIQVDGTPVPVTAEADGSYRSDTPLRGGELLEMSVRADGLPPVSGRTRVPSRPVVQDVRLQNRQVDTIKATQVSLTLDHAPEDGEYFGIQIAAETEITYMGGKREKICNYMTPGYILSAAESGIFDLEDFVQVNYDGLSLGGRTFQPITLVTRKQFDGAVYRFYLNSFDASMLEGIRGRMPGGNTGVVGGGIVSGEVNPGSGAGVADPSEIPVGLKTLYHVRFSSLSPEFYNYAKALYQSNFDFLSNMGFTPANFTWSNVSGGLGFIGAISTLQLSAIEIPEEW